MIENKVRTAHSETEFYGTKLMGNDTKKWTIKYIISVHLRKR